MAASFSFTCCPATVNHARLQAMKATSLISGAIGRKAWSDEVDWSGRPTELAVQR